MIARRYVAIIAPALSAMSPAGAQGLAAESDFPAGGTCYRRIYDVEHMRRHPEQLVRAMFLCGSSRTLAERHLSGLIDPELALTMWIALTDDRATQGDGRIARCGCNASCGGGFSITRAGGRLRIVNDDAYAQSPNSSPIQ